MSISSMSTKKKKQLSFFFCPASDYLNQFNETGSHGQISYQFMSHLSKKNSVSSIFGVVIMSLQVAPIAKATIIPLLKKRAALSDYDSLYFYIVSYLKFARSVYYKNADVIHHIIPFALGRSFNLFFLFRETKKKYIIGPIIGPHINTQITADEEYVFKDKSNVFVRVKKFLFNATRKILLTIFGAILHWLSIKTLQKADIVFFSDNHALRYHKPYLKKRQKALVLDTGIDTDIFVPAKKSAKKEKKVLDILFVGRLTKRKGCEYAINALYEAKQKQKNAQIHLSILGVGPLKADLEKLVKNLQLTKDVTFLGGVKSNEDIVKYYHKTDIVCLPALSETFTVTKEAMASGKPVIVTDVCSNAERVKLGINGFVVPPKNATAIADVFMKLSKNRTQLTKLSTNALKTRDLYNWDIILDNYVSIVS